MSANAYHTRAHAKRR